MSKTIFACILLCISARATLALDLVIEKIIIETPPLAGKFYASAAAEADKSKASYYVPRQPLEGKSAEILVNMELKDVTKNHMCKITLQIDRKEEDAATHNAEKKHSSRFLINDTGQAVLIPYLNGPDDSWVWKVIYRLK